jgi:predicted transcriptional regulator of viral defense system
MPRALGTKALALLERWEADGTRVVSLRDVRDLLGHAASTEAADQMVRRLRQARFLQRVGRGLYAVLPLAWMGEGAPDAVVVLAGIQKRGSAFFVAFDTAAGHYGWHPETYGVVTIATPRGRRIRPREVEGTRIRTVTVDAATFMDGVSSVRWRGVLVPMSNRNRTVVDAIARVDLIGGYAAVLRLLARAAKDPKLDPLELARLCRGRASVRLQKRLGYLAERAGWTWPDAALALLREGWSPKHRTTLDDPRRSQRGHWDSRWQLSVNVAESQLHPESGIR